MPSISWQLLAVPLAAAIAGCAGMSTASMPATGNGWTTTSFDFEQKRCGWKDCRETFRSIDTRLDVRSRTRLYAPREIPGWDKGSTVGRVASTIAGAIVRGVGGTTDRTLIGLHLAPEASDEERRVLRMVSALLVWQWTR